MSFSSNQGKLPARLELHRAITSLSVRQKSWLLVLFAIFIISITGIVWKLNSSFLVEAAVPGGSLSEGLIGFPNHINPLLAVTDADRNLTTLVYSGLMKLDESGKVVPDLAESFSISPDGLIYTFILKDRLTWHDGKPLTADDIEFTVAKAQDPQIKSPRRASWEGVRTEKINEREIRLILKKPYASFLENATMGIIPKHIWKDIKADAFPLSDQNLKGIGSGPYKIDSVSRGSTGLPQYYSLSSFKDYALSEPKIQTLILRFYDNNDQVKKAYERGEIESFSSVPAETAEILGQNGVEIRQISMPRSFAVFFNQSNTVFADRTVRKALALATDKEAIVKDVLKGFGSVLENPIPAGSLGHIDSEPAKADPAKAIETLEKNGWTKGSDGIFEKTVNKKTVRLAFSLATASTPELKATAEALSTQWEKIGIKAKVEVYDLSDLDQNLIRPRKYEALLFGEVLGRDPDLYSFWHSSQRSAPGLNITQYANATADKLMEDARRMTDPDERAVQYEKFQTELADDLPAIFLYSPYFLYMLPEKIKGAEFPSLTIPAERFSTIQNWYINREKVWKIFTTGR